MKRAILFSNGELTDLRSVKKMLKSSDLLIGIDGGTSQILNLGLKPDLIIGDFDSLNTIPKDIKIIKKPDQEQTDTEMALKYCEQQKIKEVILMGFLGRRLDHLLANIMNLTRFNFKITEGNQELFLLKGPTRRVLAGKFGDLISLIPLLGDCQKVTTEGLKWRLRGETLQVGLGRGVSNVMLGKKAEVSLEKGCLLVVATRM